MSIFGDLLSDTLESRLIIIKGNSVNKKSNEKSNEKGRKNTGDIGQFITKKIDQLESDSGIRESFYKNKYLSEVKKYLKKDQKKKEFIFNEQENYEITYLDFVTLILNIIGPNLPESYKKKDGEKDNKKQIYIWLKTDHKKLLDYLKKTKEEIDHNIDIDQD